MTNTGSIDADDVVLGFLSPPNAGENGVPLQVLFGFQRVHVGAGEAVYVTLYPSLIEFSQVDLGGVRRPLVGKYNVHFGVKETAVYGMGYAEHEVLASMDDVEGFVYL